MPDPFGDALKEAGAESTGSSVFDAAIADTKGKAPRKGQLTSFASDLPSWTPAPVRSGVEFIESAADTLGRGAGNLAGMLPGKIGQAGREFAASLPNTPDTKAGKYGSDLGEFMEFETAGKLPGLNKLSAAGKAGAAARIGTSAARTGIEAGVVGTADTGSLKQGAKQGVVAAGGSAGLQALGKAMSPLLRGRAQKLAERFLIPGGGPAYNKQVAKQGAEELLKRGEIALTKESFARKVEQQVMDTGQAVEQAENNLPAGAAINARPILRQLASQQRTHLNQGQIIGGYEGVYQARQQLMQQIRSRMKPNGTLDARSAIQLRRAWDKLVDWERVEGSQMPVGVRTTYEDAANALRHEIGEQVKGMKEANAQYSFWTGINKILKDKELQKVGHRPGGVMRPLVAMAAGGAVGAHGGNLENALGMAMIFGVIDATSESGLVKTLGATGMDRVGKFLNTGQYAQAVNALSLYGSTMAQDRSRQQ